MVGVATKLILGKKLKELGYKNGLAKEADFYAVKGPVFSFAKLTTVDTFLGPEMKSTGEVMGVDRDYHNALYKAVAASGTKIPSGGNVLLSVADRDKAECRDIANKLLELGFRLSATSGTYEALKTANLPVDCIEEEKVLDFVKEDKITLVINTPTRGKIPERKGFGLRRTAMEYNIPCITSLDTTNAVLSILERLIADNKAEVYSLDEYSVYRG
ncbi:MAG TPA: carbamoyl-phosphate synthase large subunit, partial [Ruminiclostridium sp.]|nr:carbamoyl-phosphate synthase large subunit [Ruminiclostridium sp.]